MLGGAIKMIAPSTELPTEFLLGVRAENLRLERDNGGSLRVLTAESVGEQIKYTVAAADGTTLVALTGADRIAAPDSLVQASVEWSRVMIFDRDRGRRIQASLEDRAPA
jgi:hypothetical protein